MGKLHQFINLIIKPQDHSLKLQSIRAAMWSALEKGGSNALRMIGSLILTRILFPEAFGIMATAQIFVVMIQLFSDVGIRTAIVQNQNGAQPEFLNTAWFICLCRGAVLSLVIIILAWPVSLYYAQPEIKTILLIMALSPLISGFENPALTVMIKIFRVEKKVALELGSQTLGLLSSIVLAYLMQSVYALAIGVVLSVLYKTLGSFIVAPYHPALQLNRTYALEIFHFGKFIFMNTLISFTAMNADIFIVGKVLHMTDLGIYSIGRNIGLLLWMICLQIFVQSYMPAISSVHTDLFRTIRIYKRTATLALALIIPVSMIFALFSHDIIRLLYDPRYQSAAISMSWFSLSGILLVLNAINSNTFIAMGRPQYETMSMAVGAIFVCILIPLGAKYFGMAGAAAGMFLSILAITIAQSFNLIFALRFPFSKVLHLWYQILLVPASIISFYCILLTPLANTGTYNIPFLVVMTVLSLAASGGLYILWEGTRPFNDQKA